MNPAESVDIRAFVEGLSSVTPANLLYLTKISLTLLKSTPALKDAALEFYCSLFNMAVRTHLQNIEVSDKKCFILSFKVVALAI